MHLLTFDTQRHLRYKWSARLLNGGVRSWMMLLPVRHLIIITNLYMRVTDSVPL